MKERKPKSALLSYLCTLGNLGLKSSGSPARKHVEYTADLHPHGLPEASLPSTAK